MSSAADKLTPMQQQYRRIKREIPPDALLLFRLGDFYELFYDDATIASQLLNLTLTARNGTPMCGIPHHAAESYIGRLLKAGCKIAICDQLEEARPGKLVNREVTQILSPGAHFDSRLLDDTRHNYLAALFLSEKKLVAQASPPVAHQISHSPLFGLAFIDLTTGDFQLTELRTAEELLTELARALPSEIIVPAEQLDETKQILQHSNTPTLHYSLTSYDGWTFEPQTSYFTLRDHFKTQSLDGFGCADKTLGVSAAGAALHYLTQGLRRNALHIQTLKVYAPQHFLVLDTITQRNLEILESVRGDRKTSLLGAMDRTVTPMGARLLRDWLTHPLRDADAINARQDVVAHFHKNTHQLADFRETLKDIKDIERSLARLSVGSGNARDLVALKESLRTIPELKEILENAARLSQPPLSALREPSADYTASPKAPRVPWRDFPEVIVSADLSEARNHPDYAAAKNGDVDAAYRFARDTLTESALAQLRALIANRNPILASIHAIEAGERRNAIPEMLAKVLADRFDLSVDKSIVQSNIVHHTGAGAFHRMAFQPVFDGSVESGRDYLIADDNIAVGGTIANLRGFIEARGGRVIGATTLTESGPSGKVALRPETLQALRQKHGDTLNNYWQTEFGHGIETLTESEARHLLKAENVDAIRNRIAAARQAANPKTGGRIDRGRQGENEDGQIIRDPAPPPLHHSAAPSLLSLLASNITPLPDLCDLVERAIVEGPPLALKEGGIIKDGFDEKLDELHRASREGKEWIAQLQQREIERTGIPSLKVRFNNVFGYYIEITKTHLAKVPSDYTRKQTVAGGERFITPELKTMEEKILGADERANALEYELFLELRKTALEQSASIQQTAAALAQLDVLAGFADLARHQNYCRPEISKMEESSSDQSKIQNLKSKIEIVDGRHPVLEQLLSEERFVPNDTFLDTAENQILIITGPNMAGKSTYIRQVALLTLMAHTGSFIPAARASISLVDRIFSRIGATDDLARGQSTFLVEMNETANILNNATPQSLVILDEIGRGTSTFDGLSIAWAVAEHLHDTIGCQTLFATHYHELTDLANTHPRVKNYNVAVREWNDQVIFLRKVIEGGADKSYGIHVARLAGLPRPLIARAKEILANLEQSELTAPHAHAQSEPPRKNPKQKPKGKPQKSAREIRETPQMNLFGQKP